jgi:hypothetical protein
MRWTSCETRAAVSKSGTIKYLSDSYKKLTKLNKASIN